MKERLPMGYTIENQDYYWSWGSDNSRQYLLLLIVIAIIFSFHLFCLTHLNSLWLLFCDTDFIYWGFLDILSFRIEF